MIFERAGRVDPVMRQIHRGGEKMFVDYAGHTVPIIDPATVEIHHSQIFISALGASNYTHAGTNRTQTLPDRIGSHCRVCEYIGGVPEVSVPDNLE